LVSHGGISKHQHQERNLGRLTRDRRSLKLRKLLLNFLREELGYQHLIVTDDSGDGSDCPPLGDSSDAVVRAFLAGEDMLLILRKSRKNSRWISSPLLAAAQDGRIRKERLPRLAKTNCGDEVDCAWTVAARLRSVSGVGSDEVNQLNSTLNYTYGGSIK
jgi:hypothetical protein